MSADDIDNAQALEQLSRDNAIRAAAKPLVPGEPGECELCGEWSGRLVCQVCAPCRDKWKLP